MTALPQDAVAELQQRIAELERQLETVVEERDAAIERQTASALVNFRLKNEVRTATERQNASAEVLNAIANTGGDAEQSLVQITEITARLFGAPSATLSIVDGDQWGRTIRVGASSKHIGTEVSDAQRRVGGRNLPGTVVRENRQIHIPDLDHVEISMADWPGLPPARATGTRVMCGTPLRRDGKAIGVLIVYRDRPEPFTDEELTLQQSFADQAVIAIENARLFKEVQERTRDLSESLQQQTATADVLKVISRSAFNLDAVLNTLVASASTLCDADNGSIFLRDDNFYRLASSYGHTAEVEAFARANPLPVNLETVTGRAGTSGAPIHVRDVLEDETRTEFQREYHKATGFRTLLSIPFKRAGETVGVFNLTRRVVRPFTERHIELVQTFADQAVIAIENTRLFNETREALERQTATADILKVIASSPSDVQPVFEAIVNSAARLFEPCTARITTLRDGMLHWHAANARALQQPDVDIERARSHYPLPFDPERSPSARAILERRIVEIPDTAAPETPEFTRRAAAAGGFRSIAFVPLINHGEGIGTIIVTHTQPGFRLSKKQLSLAQTFADQAVIAIQNTRLFNETQEALERQTATADILKVIASSPSDVQPVFDAIATSSNRLLDGFSCTVVRFIDGMAHLKAFTPTTPEADEVLQSGFPQPVASFAPFQNARAGEVTQIPDTEAMTGRILNVARARGFRSMVFAPLVNKGEPIGVIGVTRVRAGSFSDHHLQLLKTFADQAVIAIENTRLFNEVQERTIELTESLEQQTATSEVLQVISSSSGELNPVFNKMLENATRICGARFGTMTLHADGGFRTVAVYNAPKAYADMQLYKVIRPHPESGLNAVQRTREPVYIADIRNERPYLEGNANVRALADLGGARTIIIVPMLRDNELVGTITIYRQEVKPFTNKQTELVSHFANQAVIAIENARLLNELRDRTEELSHSLEDLRTAQDRLVQTEKLASLGQLTAGIAHEIKNPLNFVNNFAALSAELTDELKDVLKPAVLDETIRIEIDEITGLLKDNLSKVVQHGKRADSIVKNMLLHSREGSGEHRPADVNALVDESLNLAYHGARAEKPQFNVTLQRDFDPAAGTIEVFPQEITRVLLNLISNGFYAVTKRKADNGAADFEPLVSATTRGGADHVEIRIRDNGTGIPPEVKEKMFNPFFTTKPAGEGTGLGLSMSHDIVVKQHGGSIEVETEPGAFTEFRLVLPRTSPVRANGDR